MSTWHNKRSLSESSTGSEGPEDLSGNGFKRPRASFSSNFYERRESQASTVSSFSASESEDADVQRLNQALDSNSETEDEVPNSPKAPSNNAQYSSVAQKLMAKMGYKDGKGLGKSGQGRVEPVQASSQRGRRGLGHILKGLEDEKVTFYF